MKRIVTCAMSITVACLALTLSISAQSGPLPLSDIEGFSQTPAKSFDDYIGRLVLVEFFAYW